MIKMETLNELTLKVCASAGTQLFTKTGAFICGESMGPKNYRFDKVMFGPDEGQSMLGALGRQMMRRVTGENLALTKVMCDGECTLYFANEAQHVVVYRLAMGETISVESENILAFTPDCKYDVRFLAQGVISQKGLCTSALTGNGPEAYVAVIMDGNPIVLNNLQGGTIVADPDATVCWVGQGNVDPEVKLEMSWKNLIGQGSGESYVFEWNNYKPVTVLIQPNERQAGVSVSMDGGSNGSRPTRQTFEMGGMNLGGMGGRGLFG